jgi:hypothetical protein
VVSDLLGQPMDSARNNAMTTTPAGPLPQFITDGGIETHIIFNMGVELPSFSPFPAQR